MNLAALSELGRRTGAPPIAWLMKLTLERPNLISLAAGFTDHESLPVPETREVLAELLSRRKRARATLQYGSNLGDPQLRAFTAERLRQQDQQRVAGERYVPERILVTHGSQQLLYLVTECMCDPGDIVILEDPTYFVYLGILQSHGVRCRGVPMAGDGIDLNALKRVLCSLKESGEISRLKMVYLVSYFQNPSGITTAFEKKVQALELLRSYEKAAGHPLYLLEDAAYRELRFAGSEVSAALAAGKLAERVIYAGTYSKPFATGVRVGFGWLPEPLFTVVARLKGNHDFGTSNLLQQLMAQAMLTGRYEKHLPVLQRRYARKANAMNLALKENFPADVQWLEPSGGMYIWTRLPARIKSGVKSKLFQRALERDVLYVPGELCYAEDRTRQPRRHEMRLSFGGATEADIREGIARLGEVIRGLQSD